MKILKFKGKMSLKNRVLIVLIGLLVIFAISIGIIYVANKSAREWININILRKEITEEDIATIEIDVDKTQYIYAYDKYIVILCNGKLEIYNNYGNKMHELEIAISNPIFKTNGTYLVIAESDGQRAYLITDGKILWEHKLEGSISKVNVNSRGDVSIITKGTSYKSVIVTFDKSGKELFKTYLASTIAVATDISIDGKYLAIAEVNTNGALISSSIKIIETEKASTGDTTNSVIYNYSADSNNIITDIKYQEKERLVCIYDNSIHIICEGEDAILTEFNSNVQIADINLKSYTVRAEEISTSLFKAKTDVILTNILTKTDMTYSVESVVKELVSYDEITAINLGTEIHFINLNGWLEKKYTSTQEIKDIVLGTSVAGIVYRDRIKILTL